jgi:hypothetical protein
MIYLTVSCGTQTKALSRGSSSVLTHKLMGRLLGFCVALIFQLVITACTPTIEFGAEPRTDSLQGLIIGESDKADVVVALGEPRGDGGAEFSRDAGKPREIWFYEYVRSDGKNVDLEILLVFFRDDRYEGHWWFSSTDEFE